MNEKIQANVRYNVGFTCFFFGIQTKMRNFVAVFARSAIVTL